jgi:tRNA G10  N-methylase Trm11
MDKFCWYNAFMESKTRYIFILGRSPELSLAEIQALFEKHSIPFELTQKSNEVAIIESRDGLDMEGLNKTLGGTIKIGQVVKELQYSDKVGDVADLFSAEFLKENFFQDVSRKLEFGLSIYNCRGGEYFDALCSSQQDIQKTIKDNLNTDGIKSHYPQIASRTLSSASVEKNGLLKRGAEILLIVTDKSLIIGKTLAVQEFEEFSRRDFGRPKRDMRSGVMPPKLARMMINLAQIDKRESLLDPFCGSGTVIQEALYLGYTYIKGFDNSKKAVEDTQENIEWLGKVINLKETKIEIKMQDVRQLSKSLASNSIAGIVAEPYLGPTIHRSLKDGEIGNISKDLKNLYLAAFKEFVKVLKEKGVIVFILPAFAGKDGIKNMDILNDIKSIGFEQISLSENSRQSVIFGREGDFVMREIVKFQKV